MNAKLKSTISCRKLEIMFGGFELDLTITTKGLEKLKKSKWHAYFEWELGVVKLTNNKRDNWCVDMKDFFNCYEGVNIFDRLQMLLAEKIYEKKYKE